MNPRNRLFPILLLFVRIWAGIRMSAKLSFRPLLICESVSMMLIWAKRLAVVASVALAGVSAQAATITFDLTGRTSLGSSMAFHQDGLGLVVSSAHVAPSGALIQSGLVSESGSGLGMLANRKDDTAKLDGKGQKEVLEFLFSSDVTIKSITFALIKVGSKATGYMDGMLLGFASVSPNIDVSALGLHSDYFGIGAKGKDSAFRISSITVSTVPVPAAGLLLLSGLAGLSVFRRKRRA